MPAFVVQAVDRSGIRRSLTELAPDAAAAKAQVRARELWPVAVRPAKPTRTSRLRLPMRDFIAVLNQWELQTRAGLTADVALRELAEGAAPGPARTLLRTIHEAVAGGEPIHAACRRFPRQFPEHVAAVIAAGEASAQLPEALRALAAHLSEVDALKRTARRALVYPALVLCVSGGLIVFLLGGVVPKFAEIFGSMHMRLPTPTRVLIEVSETLRRAWPVYVGGAAAVGVVAWMAARTPRLKRMRDGALLRIPVLGETLRCLSTARFAAHTRLLHEAGVPMLDALGTGADLTGNAVLAAQLNAARSGVAAGQSLASALPKGHAFPIFVVPALKAGESTGQLAAALRHIEEYAATRARDTLAMAMALLEPALLTVLTGIVGFIVLSFFLPLFSLLGGINQR